MVCVGSDEAWISGDDTSITRVDIHGSMKENVAIPIEWPNFTLKRQGELLFSNNKQIGSTVDIVKQRGIETYITLPQGWDPHRLCCTRSGDVLVHVRKNKYNKFLRYRGQQISQKIDKDLNGKPIISEGIFILSITENNNGDICVSDRNAETVIVVDRAGRVRFRYDGKQTEIKGYFIPIGIVTDSRSQIIVSDIGNDCLHIIDQNGKYLKCVAHCGLEFAWGLSLDSKGRLWVALGLQKVIKVIKYFK